MSRTTDLEQYALGLLVEEAGEVLQLGGNSLRFGIDSPRNDGTTARQLLPTELGDLMAAITYLAARGLVDMDDVVRACNYKLEKLNNPAAVDNLGRRLAP